jgi:hypothetical protein
VAARPGALELSAPGTALLDEPLVVRVRGAGEKPPSLLWRARVRDDDGRVWRATAKSPGELAAAWDPAKDTTGDVAALQSMRPVQLDLRVEASDGRGATRTLTRRLLADGVRVRRWREGVTATLLLPAVPPTAAIVAAVTPAGLPAAALLASRGVLVFAVREPRQLDRGIELLADVPAAAMPEGARRFDDPLPLPPGLPARTTPDDAAWDALLAELSATPRELG